ncbi:MAG: PorT family protein [Bacteroidetes bacterium]|nr:PorT family protein [Bacteroidota bacterium]
MITVLSVVATAQSFHLGAKAGANLGKIDGQSFNSSYNLGYLAGAYAEIGITKTIAIQPELLFTQTNTKIDSGFQFYKPSAIIGSKAHLNYLNVPILLNIKPSKLITLQVGPQFGILLNKDETLLTNTGNAIKNGDFSVLAGAQVNLGLLNIYGRYAIGLYELNDLGNEQKWKSQAIQVGLGLRIF